MIELNIISGSVTLPAEAGALVLLVLGVGRAPSRRAIVVIGSGLAVAAVAATRIWSRPGSVPSSFPLWATAMVVAVAVAVRSWREVASARRLLAVTTIVVVGIAAGLTVNAHYGYYPTFADLVHHPLPNQIAVANLPTAVAVTAVDRPRSAEIGQRLVPSRPIIGRLVQVQIPNPKSKFVHRSEWVYLPPVWFSSPTPALPVVVMLPGTPGTTEDWIRGGGAVRTADRWAARHHGRAPILVFADPNGSFTADTECVDNRRHQVDTYLSHDVPAFVKRAFATSSDPARWAIAGVSAGGTCALTIALRHPDVYRVVVDLSGELTPNLGGASVTLRTLFDGCASHAASYDPLTLLKSNEYRATNIWFGAGRSDRSARRALEQLASAAKRSRIDVVTSERGGGHTWRYWRRAFVDSFSWLNDTIDRPGASL